MALRLELSASFDYHDHLLPDFPRLLARTSSLVDTPGPTIARSSFNCRSFGSNDSNRAVLHTSSQSDAFCRPDGSLLCNGCLLLRKSTGLHVWVNSSREPALVFVEE
jgi:hypothetical protein